MKIEVSDAVFARLQKLAVPLVDSTEDVIRRLLDLAEQQPTQRVTQPSDERTPMSYIDSLRQLHSLRGFQLDLWNIVIQQMPFDRFTYADIKQRQSSLQEKHSHIQAFDESIRAALQKLRDKGLIEFVDRGVFRRLASPPRP